MRRELSYRLIHLGRPGAEDPIRFAIHAYDHHLEIVKIAFISYIVVTFADAFILTIVIVIFVALADVVVTIFSAIVVVVNISLLLERENIMLASFFSKGFWLFSSLFVLSPLLSPLAAAAH